MNRSPVVSDASPIIALEEQAAWLLLDDLPGRELASSLGLPVLGTLGVLLRAKRHGLLPRIRPHLDALVRVRFRMSPALYASILRDSGEGQP